MPSRLSYVWLSLKRGLGSRTAAEVLDTFGSPEAVFAADRQALTAAPCELRKTHVDLLCDKDTSEAEQVIRSCTEKNIRCSTARRIVPTRRNCSCVKRCALAKPRA